MTHHKESVYQKYIGRFEETTDQGYYFESAWLQYVLLEDRLVSLLKYSGGETRLNGSQIKMMGPKIDELKQRCLTNEILRGQLESGNLIDRLIAWKTERNNLMHSMADGILSTEEIELKIKNLAVTGATLTREVASAARRFKKQVNG